jgi:D-amino-acid dehydrogenase
MQHFDAIVLGAGIVGVSAAWHLLRRGKSVILVDRRGPGEEASYGNAGVVERDGWGPMNFPSKLTELIRYAGNRQPQMHYHPGFIPRIARYLLAMRAGSHRTQWASQADAIEQIMKWATTEHRALAEAAGARRYFRETGLLRIYRSEAGFLDGKADRDFGDRYGAAYDVLDGNATTEIEPNLKPDFYRAVLWKDTDSVSSPGKVTRAYADTFAGQGGKIVKGDALTLRNGGSAWLVDTEIGPVTAPVAIAALGGWSGDLLKRFGYRVPFAVIRGYHRHYRPIGNASLSRPVLDSERGFVITPMEQGIRLTTGYEFAARDAPATPVQVGRVLPLARQLFPLGEPVDEPWLGRRPCIADSLPVIGPAPRHPGLYFDFGHGHLGFTLGPVSGRLLAEMITGHTPVADPKPYALTRFAGY